MSSVGSSKSDIFLFTPICAPQCLVEAVCILDCVCTEDSSLVYRTFPCVKALFGRLSSDLTFARVLLPIAQFYLNHGLSLHHAHLQFEVTVFFCFFFNKSLLFLTRLCRGNCSRGL